ncbi:hypothetical protein [Nocardiopsis sp. NPDC057823]|uniref:hypothetical protein n=1 Tax=Nocardiopsis sp. NPDC057823 TaxID=3346256 RepID=UPI00366F748F
MDDGEESRAFLLKRAFWVLHLELGVPRELGEEWYGPGLGRDGYRHFERHLWARRPSFTVPLVGGCLIRISYRNEGYGDGHTAYEVVHDRWEEPEPLGLCAGNGSGPGLCWEELLSAADGVPSGHDRLDPYTRLLLLLPMWGGDRVPPGSVHRLAQALYERMGMQDARAVATAMLERGGQYPARWTTTGTGVLVNDGIYSTRSPGSLSSVGEGARTRLSEAFSRRGPS